MRSILVWVLSFRVATLGVALGWTILLGSAPAGHATVFHAKQEALQLAFPNADRIETKSFFLTLEQVDQVANLAKAPVDSKLATFHVGYQADVIQGYACIETHLVRTMPETFLIVLSPTGSVQKLLVLAFYEPPEYLPPERWLDQFNQKTLTPSLQLRQDIHGVMGALWARRRD